MNEIRFRFNAKKAAQAAYKLLRFSGGQRNYMELVKLLYLSDREALVHLGCPITGDRFVSLPHGPVLSHVLDLIKSGPMNPKDAPWFDSISAPIGYEVKLLNDCGDDDLSGAEEQILCKIFAKFGKMDWKELSIFTHDLPEWSDPNGGARPISLEHILRFEGKSADIERIRNSLSVFGCLDNELAEYERLPLEDEQSLKVEA